MICINTKSVRMAPTVMADQVNPDQKNVKEKSTIEPVEIPT